MQSNKTMPEKLGDYLVCFWDGKVPFLQFRTFNEEGTFSLPHGTELMWWADIDEDILEVILERKKEPQIYCFTILADLFSYNERGGK